MDGGSRLDSLVQELARVYFDEQIAWLVPGAEFAGFTVFVHNAGAMAYSACGCVLYRVGAEFYESERLHVKHLGSTAQMAPPARHLLSLQLSAELHFYRWVVPVFRQLCGYDPGAIDQLVPRFYAGSVERSAAQDVGAIVFGHMEKYRNLGYRRQLDARLVAMALRKIAAFHAHSLQARLLNWEVPVGELNGIYVNHPAAIAETLRNSLEPLAALGEYAGWVPRLRNLVDHLEHHVGLALMQRNEYSWVLCHRNYSQVNFLVHFEETARNEAKDVRIVNWQWMGYASLGVDLVILLFVETHPQTLRANWSGLLRWYLRSLGATFENDFGLDERRLCAEIKESVPIALYVLAERANLLHLRNPSPVTARWSQMLWNEELITEVFKELIRRDLV